MPFCPFCCMVPLSKLNNRKKGTLIIMGSLGNLVVGISTVQGFRLLGFGVYHSGFEGS